MKRILVNATQAEELRVAIVDGQRLFDLDIETTGRGSRKANVYKGRITRVEPSLEAAFVEYGGNRHGFLPLKEIARSYFADDTGDGKVEIKKAIKEGQEVIVQVEKEERGTKGAALTTFPSLAGRFLVLMPNNPRAGGVSRRIDGDDRNELREAMAGLDIPKGMGAIARTAGVGRTTEELQWDLNYLVEMWTAIEKAAENRKAPFLIYEESSIIIRTLRDYLRGDISDILIDEPAVFEQAKEFMEAVMPANLSKLKFYDDRIPLFSRYQIESQIETAFQRDVRLPSGGSIVIDHTEALTAVDINSARATGGKSIEETALNTNLEAADEVARQLRLRDLGGLVVIDFIDMGPNKNQRDVENRLRNAVGPDRARVQIGRISRFGLMEMSRQRLRPSLGEHAQISCPRCSGEGQIRSVQSTALSVLRLVEEEALKDNTGRVIAQLPVRVASFLLNEKRSEVAEIESRCKVALSLLPNPTLESPNFEIRRVRGDHLKQDDNDELSHKLIDDTPEDLTTDVGQKGKVVKREEPAVQALRPSAPIPQVEKPVEQESKPGFWARLWAALTGGGDKPEKAKKPAKKSRDANRKQASGGGRKQSRDSGRNNRGGQNRGRGNQPRRGGEQRKGRQQNAKNQDDKAKNQQDNKQADDAKSADGGNKPRGDQNKRSGDQSGEKRGDGNRSRRRGRRGGRRNRRNTGDGQQDNKQTAQSSGGGENNRDNRQQGNDQGADKGTDKGQADNKQSARHDGRNDARNASGNTRGDDNRGGNRGQANDKADNKPEAKPDRKPRNDGGNNAPRQDRADSKPEQRPANDAQTPKPAAQNNAPTDAAPSKPQAAPIKPAAEKAPQSPPSKPAAPRPAAEQQAAPAKKPEPKPAPAASAPKPAGDAADKPKLKQVETKPQSAQPAKKPEAVEH
ncbi:Rne/Rng family ribonuclease [bacterium]|nr:Rne/Rng family ribonuclease [bacterium]